MIPDWKQAFFIELIDRFIDISVLSLVWRNFWPIAKQVQGDLTECFEFSVWNILVTVNESADSTDEVRKDLEN